jgi:putative membrane-bound dehydrogenase-like protein
MVLMAGLWASAGADSAPAASDPPRPAVARHHVPEGFILSLVAGAPDVCFPMFACFDDRGRLFVAESSGLDLYAELRQQTRNCRIRLLEDPGPDGRFRKARVFADHLVFPMGLAWRDGKLYVADPPDLVILEDTKGQGRADRRTVLLSGFGHLDNGSLHGLTFGPDGLLYLTMGEPDGYKLRRPDGTWLEGRSGALLRCRPDGSEPEVFCRGFVNLVEVAFTPRGDILGTDNWFRNVNDKTSGGLRDGLVHLVDGGLYPFHPDEGTPQPVTGPPLPPVTLLPAVALSGLVCYSGSAFPTEMRGQFFSAQHNARKVGRHALVPAGSTFRSEDFDFVTSDDADFHPSDVLEDADGSLLVIDTGSWYVHHCPTGRIRPTKALGGIYRVRAAHAPAVSDPWGLRIDWSQASAARLVELLADRRPAVRERARRTLVDRGPDAVPILAAALDRGESTAVRQQAIWTLAGIADPAALAPLRGALECANPEVAAAAAYALARRGDRRSAAALCRLLLVGAPPVQRPAAEALAHCGDRHSLPVLWQALKGQPDRFLEHSVLYALHRLADADALHAALKEPHPRVQKAALVLLDQPPRPRGLLAPDAVIGRISAPDPELRQAALAILQRHPEWAEHAVGLVRRWLEQPVLTYEEQTGLRTLLLAFQERASVQELIAEVLAGKRPSPVGRQILLLEDLAEVTLPELPASWVAALSTTARQGEPAVRRQAVRTAAVLQVPALDETLAALAERRDEPLELRLEALRAVILRRPALSDALFELLLGRLSDPANPLTRLSTAEILSRSHLSDRQLLRLLAAARGDALVSPSTLLPALARSVSDQTARAVLAYLSDALRGGWRPSEAELDRVLNALPATVRSQAGSVRALLRQGIAGQQARLAQLEPLLRGGGPGRGRNVFFGGKVSCATCHRIGSEGGTIGPDLTRIGAVRTARDLLESIVFPSSTIAQGYDSYVVVTTDGRTLTGLLARQTGETLVLRDSSGALLRLRKDQVEEMKRSATSLMPERLEQALTGDELRDLLAFLQSLK